jgi:hypothetical protein
MRAPSLGKTVIFVLPRGNRPGFHRPANVVAFDASKMTVNLQVFCDGNKTDGDVLGNLFWWKNAPYDPAGIVPGSWHWPHQEPIQTETETGHHD